MIPFPYNYAAALVAVGGSLMGAFLYGQHTATVSAERDALERDVAMYRSVDELARRLRVSDEALTIEQQRVATVRREEVKIYVDKYRTKLVDRPVIIECVNDSGLLDLINGTMPTVAARVGTAK
jgi:hypothetical protein